LCVFSPQSHLTCEERDLRIERQCWHCDTGLPFLLMCWSGRSWCWQLLTRCPLTQASQAHFSPSMSMVIGDYFPRLVGVGKKEARAVDGLTVRWLRPWLLRKKGEGRGRRAALPRNATTRRLSVDAAGRQEHPKSVETGDAPCDSSFRDKDGRKAKKPRAT